ncbi:MAG: hypothetical protein KQJ78_19060 [Deltaproteobacteria bacterium]|nr:hypothetical protein [Deltaproteobacteria bacterium]
MGYPLPFMSLLAAFFLEVEKYHALLTELAIYFRVRATGIVFQTIQTTALAVLLAERRGGLVGVEKASHRITIETHSAPA